MSAKNESGLSSYRDVAVLNKQHDVRLVQQNASGPLLVRKKLTHYDRRVLDYLLENDFPGIPRIRDLIEDGDTLYLIEDYISGQNLSDKLNEHVFTEVETVQIIMKLCSILRPLHAHHPQIIHRDIKASNLIINESGDLYLIDFDASKMHDPQKDRDTVLIGTEGYAAPEQYGFGQSDRRTDIYAVGVLMKKMLDSQPSDNISPDLKAVIETCMQLNPKDRFDSVDALSAALAHAVPALQEQSSTVPHKRTNPPATKSEKPAVRKPFYRNITGFRTGSKVADFTAVVWYAFLVFLLFTFEPLGEDGKPLTGVYTWIIPLMLFLILLAETLYLGNSYGCRDRFPFRRLRGKSKAGDFLLVLAGAVIICFVLFAATVLVAAVLS